MIGMSVASLVVGMTGMVLGDRTFTFAAATGLSAAAVIGEVTVVILQISGRRRPRRGRHYGGAR